MHDQITGCFCVQLMQMFDHFWMTFVSAKQTLHDRVRFSESKSILNTSKDSCLQFGILFEKIEALDHLNKME